MRIKKYTAPTMKDALLQIKKELGDEAMILKTRKLPSMPFPRGNRNTVEVTAAVDDHTIIESTPQLQNHAQQLVSSAYRGSTYPTQQENPPDHNNNSATMQSDTACLNPEQITDLHDDIHQLKELVSSLVSASSTSHETAAHSLQWTDHFTALLGCGINSHVASEILEKARNASMGEGDLASCVVAVLNESFKVTGPLAKKTKGPMVAAFIGPTGSGKTTTIAKLAAYYSLNKKFRVSLVTADTYRIAAIEQIRSFADILGLPLRILFADQDIEGVMAECNDDEMVFIDTAGRSQNNRLHMTELKKVLGAINPDVTSLVLSATTKDDDLREIVHHYREYGLNQLLFTKLDETTRLGNVLNTVLQTRIPVSYLTTGQNVPDDIELAQPNRFVQRLIQGTELC